MRQPITGKSAGATKKQLAISSQQLAFVFWLQEILPNASAVIKKQHYAD